MSDGNGIYCALAVASNSRTNQALPFEVGLPVGLEKVRETPLLGRITGGLLQVRAQVVPKIRMVAVCPRPVHHDVLVVLRRPPVVRMPDVPDASGAFVQVAKRRQLNDGVAHGSRVRDNGISAGDRLACHTRDRSAADMLHPQRELLDRGPDVAFALRRPPPPTGRSRHVRRAGGQ